MSNVSASFDAKTLYCSFCGKAQHEVQKLIAGPSVFICDECVGICVEILGRAEIPLPEAEARQFRKIQRDQAAVDIAQIVRGLLEDEQERRRPFENLQETLKIFEEAAEPSSESGPGSVADFP